MKSDLDALLQANDIDAILVTGPGQHNPAMVYLTGGAPLTQADLIKLRGRPPILFHRDMERDEAAHTSAVKEHLLETRNLAEFDLPALRQQAHGDALGASVLAYQHMLQETGLTRGRVALYGRIEAGAALSIFSALQQAMPGLTFVSELENTLLMQAMSTKDADEIDRIQRMGMITTSVVARTADYLSGQRVQAEILVKADGSPLTIGDVKQHINLWLAEAGVDNPDGTIFAIGADSAVPHSSGTPHQALRTGQTLIFDIFPCEAGGGYYYDFTRTWCLGYAPDEALALYEDVLYVFRAIQDDLQPGLPTRAVMERACDLFEQRGHSTQRSHPQSQDGFVHGLGHSLGLNVHERPQFSLFASPQEVLLPGMVMTVEPGLYYPQKGLGVRLEDTIWMLPDGTHAALAEFPLDLVLPVNRT